MGNSSSKSNPDLAEINRSRTDVTGEGARKKKKGLRKLRYFRSADSVGESQVDREDSEINPKAPAKVVFQGQDLQLAYEPAGDGTLVVKHRDIHEPDSAATRIQTAVRRHQARALYKGLRALESMQLELKWPTGAAFIGLIVVRVKDITDVAPQLAAVRHPLIRARCDGDQSISIRGHHDPSTGTVKYDFKATFVFVALHSAAFLTIDVVQSLELATRIIGKVRIPVASMSQGTDSMSCNILSNSVIMGVMNLNIGYQWMRGTQDFGGYDGSHIMVLPTRKVRKPNAAVERLWKVNHWLCAHDNIWGTTTKFEDVVKMAVQKKNAERMDTAILTESGRYVTAPKAVVSEIKKQTSDGKPRGATIPTAELLARTITIENWEGVESFGTLSSAHQRSVSDAGTLGVEDWHLVMEELYDAPHSMDTIRDENAGDDEELPKEIRKQLDEHGKNIAEYAESDSDEDVQIPVGATPSMRKRQDELAEKYDKRRKRKGFPTLPSISGKFEYGVYRPASKRDVHLFIRKAEHSVDLGTPKPIYAGVHTTNTKGNLVVPLPKQFIHTPGHYHILGLLPDDNTFGRGSVFMLERGTKCVVFDLDGTMTTSDVHVVTQVFLDSLSGSTVIGGSLGQNYDLKQRTNALSVCRLWAAKGYQVIYLSGRQGSAYNMTAWWLIRHGYPPGPIHLTRTHVPTLPLYTSVGKFKVKYMEELMARGLEIFAAYGNTGTDVKAYERIGIPKERTFIVGPNGGSKGTRRVTNFTSHLPEILKFPDSDKPIPYTELLFSSPGHRSESAQK